MRYRIEYQPAAAADIAALRAHDRAIVLTAIGAALQYEPTVVTRNRKPVVAVGAAADTGITWELRVGAFRVYYDVELPAAVVIIRVVRKGGKTTEETLK